ncbi:uncharacterized protein LOC107773109 [Nicotiana tabacum]|uniref:Uncharacterized protein n=2 Tax=Nicotiana tabacum TaxID=4097 RepID=A0A1S3Y7R7_TOBAC|nr:PREDICTED: uncharacterized protein LOC107773109 [Nicotiana tabacum]XP_016448043.1 PREDICTED: uncharacterized protein LOC107773109 [Nicotiana tabacum]
MLIAYTLKSSSESPSTPNVAPFEDEIVPISAIPSQSTAQSFYVEGEISLPSEFQLFFVFLCSECQHLARIKRKTKVLCIKLQAIENVDSKKSLLRTPDRAAGIFVILSYTQKTGRLRLATIFNINDIGEGSKRKIESITSVEADRGPSTKDATASKKPNIQSPSPPQKH